MKHSQIIKLLSEVNATQPIKINKGYVSGHRYVKLYFNNIDEANSFREEIFQKLSSIPKERFGFEGSIDEKIFKTSFVITDLNK